MPKKTIIIFITTFIAVGVIILGIFFWINRNKTNSTTGTTPWYQSFNPFGTGSNITTNNPDQNTNIDENQLPGTVDGQTSRFYQITDFAVSGATFLNDTRPISNTTPEIIPEPVKTIISANTKEGKIEIQKLLNDTLSLNPPLVTDGVFGKKVTGAIKDFQKLNNLTITGKIDTETAPFFTTTSTTVATEKSLVEEAPSVRYVERVNGHIYKMFLDTKSKEKISNSTIPAIYEAVFNSTGNSVVYRYISEDGTISSFIATLGTPKGEFLPPDVSDLSVSQDKTKFFYLTKNENGSIGYMGTFGATKKDSVFNSPFTEWLSQWDDNNRVFLTTKPSYSVTGSVFMLNDSNKTISKVLGGIMGLTTLVSPSGSVVLYSSSTDTGPKLGVFNANDRSMKDLNTYGLPEKCVWSSDNINVYCAVPSVITGNQYPDFWYQGLISFDDYFVKINTITGQKTTIANSVNETPIDGTYLFLDKTESNLFFTNKKDYTLWGLNIQ